MAQLLTQEFKRSPFVNILHVLYETSFNFTSTQITRHDYHDYIEEILNKHKNVIQ